MPSAAEEQILASPRGKGDFSLAAGLAVLETYDGENEATGKNSHQGIFSNKRTIAVGPTWVKWQKTHQDSGPVWWETAVGSGETFKYDPFGRRIQKNGPSGTVNYLYDGINLLEEVDAGGNVLARYTQTADVDAPLAMLRSGTTSYYQFDALGSSTSLSNTVGALAATYTYDSFGKQTATTGAITNPFRYTGREFDSETGIYQYRARYYDQNSGRFISEDPIRFKGGPDFYAYADNSSPNEADPFGLTGGPKNPRVPTRCKWSDSCSTLRGKAFLLERAISSHQGWDWTMPWPRGGSRHAQEIAEFWNALARCFQIYDKKCKDRGCDPKSSPEPVPQPVPIMPIDPIVPDMPGIPEMPFPEFFPDPIFIF